jgi:hypothetical protein
MSSQPETTEYEDDSEAPCGALFRSPKDIGPELVGKTGTIRRSFGPLANADAMLVSGGQALAAHASFDPDYGRARDWIRSHPVGDSVLSPILISGLIGALIEARFPQSIAINSSLQLERPLIVGVEVRAKIEVVGATHTGKPENFDGPSGELAMSLDQRQQDSVRERKTGHQVDISTQVVRVRDNLLIAKGAHSIWIPDYLHM